VARHLSLTVYEYLDYRAFLRDAYRDLKAKQRGFSYRWFARRAGVVAPNFLKLVSDGKRNLTQPTARRFAEALGLDTQESVFFCNLVAFGQARTPAEKNSTYERLGAARGYRAVRSLERQDFEYLSRWYYPAVHELVSVRGFREDPDWIAQRLIPPITPAQAREALALLGKLGFLRRDESGVLRRADPLLSTGPEVRSLAIGNFHRQMMERAARSIELVDREDRDISGLTLALSRESFRMFKQKIVALRAELLQLSGEERAPTRVVQLNFQLFPLARNEEAES
jgi:uncharacterized protein (TIGR02147 family)